LNRPRSRSGLAVVLWQAFQICVVEVFVVIFQERHVIRVVLLKAFLLDADAKIRFSGDGRARIDINLIGLEGFGVWDLLVELGGVIGLFFKAVGISLGVLGVGFLDLILSLFAIVVRRAAAGAGPPRAQGFFRIEV